MFDRRRDEWDLKVHHHHTTPDDDEKAGIRRCASCGRPIVIGAECMDCAKEHPGSGLGPVAARRLFGG